MKSAYVRKKYNYTSEYYDLNSGINFLSNQINDINKIDMKLMSQYKDYLKKDKKYSDNADALIIINDINQFTGEYNNALDKLHRTLNRARKGSLGENKVKEIIYTYIDDWKVIESATFDIDGTKIENDFLIIDESGITSIEVKNIGTGYEKLKIDTLGRVSRLNKFNDEVEVYDMIEQSNRHVAYLHRLLNKLFEFHIPINTSIVITSKINIDNKSDFRIYGPNQIYKEVKKQVPVLNNEQVELIYQELLAIKIAGVRYPYLNYAQKLKDNYTLILKSLRELLI